MILSTRYDIPLLIIGILTLMVMALSMRIIAKDEVMVVSRIRQHRRVLQRGIHFLIPFIDVAVGRYSLNEQLLDVFVLQKGLKDDKPINFFVHITYYIDDFISFSNTPHLYPLVHSSIDQIIINFVNQFNHEELLVRRDQLNQLIYESTQSQFQKLGLKLNQIYCYYE
ncbi:MAG: SPFH domain-containing protein [Bacilli bacterium]